VTQSLAMLEHELESSCMRTSRAIIEPKRAQFEPSLNMSRANKWC